MNKITRNDNFYIKNSNKFNSFTLSLNKSINIKHSVLLNRKEGKFLIEKNNYFKDINLNQTNLEFKKQDYLILKKLQIHIIK